MSVTITVQDNIRYCRENNLVGKTTYDCQCKDFPEILNCEECNGTKEITFDKYPFELNISNRNFQTLWSALGIDFDPKQDWVGTIRPHIILKVLHSFDEQLVLRNKEVDKVKNKATFIDFGISPEQVEHYITTLSLICEEAQRREENVFWC